eukprot:NP_001342319.1 proline-rich protein 26 isoform 4 [Homo sapiens]
MESSRWDKDPPGERRPQQSQHWRARDHGARGCGPRQPTATASPRPGLWITPAHGSHTPQTNTRRTQADNIFIYDPVLTCITPMMASQRGFRSPVGLPHQRGLLTSRATNVDTIPSGTTYFCIPSTVLRSQGGPSKLWNNQTRD